MRRLGFLLLLAGLVAPLSRGPWVGAVCIFTVFILTGKRALSRFAQFTISGVIALAVLSALPGGERIYNLIPFIGETGAGSITYRERLLENSWAVIQRHPIFGSVNYKDTPEMQSMMQGQGIIDIVNTYVWVALKTGLVGLALFSGFFLSICWGVFRSLQKLPENFQAEHLLGRSLLATLLGIMLIIFTVSSVSIIPLVYWSIAGLGVAYINMVKHKMLALQNQHASF